MDRCLWWPAVGPPMLPSFANNSPYHTLISNYQFMQVPGYVVIVNEILHLTRVIPWMGARISHRKSVSGWETRAAGGKGTR